ncbi:MAG: hypothetical protein K0Q48_1834 [Bacillota bacterium]|jgi:competence protein ComEC|nr:hypothetical protein [Bacillota bacterium]
MRVHFVNVGYGEAILIEKDDYRLLVDGGTDRATEYEAKGSIRVAEYLKKLKVPKVDMMIVTHIHDDHIGGLPEVIRVLPVGEVLINVNPPVLPIKMIANFESVRNGNLSGNLFRNALLSYAEMVFLCGERGIPIKRIDAEAGIISPVPGLELEFLTPNRQLQDQMMQAYQALSTEKDEKKAESIFYSIDQHGNASSIAMRVKAGKAAILLSGDKVDGWDSILEKYKDRLCCGILKATHHGQLDGLPEAMVEVAQPDHFVICSSEDRRFNSAHPEVIERIRSYLKETGKQGGVYITGHLGEAENADPAMEKPCAVIFDCKEDTGEITVEYSI